jgi:hypothetical protein
MLDVWGSNSSRVKQIFLHSFRSKLALAFTASSMQYRQEYHEVTRPGREADHSPPCSAEVKKGGATIPLLDWEHDPLYRNTHPTLGIDMLSFRLLLPPYILAETRSNLCSSLPDTHGRICIAFGGMSQSQHMTTPV